MEEQEFSFLELFKYALKKWFILVAALVLGMAAAFVYAWAGHGDTPTVNAYEGSIRYVGDLPAVDSSDFGARYEYYKIRAATSIAVMTSTQVKNEVYEQFRSELYKDMKKDEDRSEEFFKALNFEIRDYTLYVSFGRIMTPDDTDLTLTCDIVENYLSAAAEAARLADPTLVGAGKLIINDPVKVYSVKRYYELFGISDATRSLSTWLILGAFGGLVVGAVIILIIYAADPRLKSFRSVGYLLGGRSFGVAESEESLRRAAVDIDNSLKLGDKTVCLISPKPDAMTSEASAVLAATFAREGYRTLLVSFTGSGDGFERYLSGDGAAAAVEKAENFDRLSGGREAWLRLGPNAKRFEALKSEYDRVLIDISAPESGGAGTAVRFSDAAVMVIDCTDAKKSDVVRAAESLPAEDREKLLGALLHNLSKSYVG